MACVRLGRCGWGWFRVRPMVLVLVLVVVRREMGLWGETGVVLIPVGMW